MHRLHFYALLFSLKPLIDDSNISSIRIRLDK
nr:MAG TPA: hypothetical protein [Caudoviricetes sp.]